MTEINLQPLQGHLQKRPGKLEKSKRVAPNIRGMHSWFPHAGWGSPLPFLVRYEGGEINIYTLKKLQDDSEMHPEVPLGFSMMLNGDRWFWMTAVISLPRVWICPSYTHSFTQQRVRKALLEARPKLSPQCGGTHINKTLNLASSDHSPVMPFLLPDSPTPCRPTSFPFLPRLPPSPPSSLFQLPLSSFAFGSSHSVV